MLRCSKVDNLHLGEATSRLLLLLCMIRAPILVLQMTPHPRRRRDDAQCAPCKTRMMRVKEAKSE